MRVGSFVLLLLVLKTFLLAVVLSIDPSCSSSEGSQAPLLDFCVGEILSSSSFTADPEMRTFEGVEVMVMTAVPVSLPHLYMASRASPNDCWGNVTQVTFDEFANSTWTCYNEVASFTFQSYKGSPQALQVYYNHYCQPPGNYDGNAFSVRMKVGIFNASVPGVTFFGPEVFTGPTINTWVIWANIGAQPTERALAVNNPPLSANLTYGCGITTEVSVWSDGNTWWLSMGCIHSYVPLQFDVRIVSATNPLFINATAPRKLIAPDDWCTESQFPYGFQAGSIVQFKGEFYLMVSPLISDTGNYEGCVVFRFQGNSLDNPLNLNQAVGMQSYLSPHTGSCTGGAGSNRIQDMELSLAVPYFFQNRSAPGQFYHLHQASFDSILFPSSTSSSSAKIWSPFSPWD